jgi:FkbM family methyltransferase
LSDDIAAEIELLRRLVLQERGVDMVRLGPYLNLVYTDDQWYQQYPGIHKSRTIYDLANHQKPAAPPIEDIGHFMATFDVGSDPWRFVVAHYSRVFERFAFCDIGAQYGSAAMEIATFLRSLRAECRILSFEPGIAGDLTKRNFENNGFPEISFYQPAAGPVDGHVVLHREIGHSANNRIVNPARRRDWGSTSLPVRCVRVDTALKAQGAFGPTLAKIDTQGGEPGVLMGMSEVLNRHPVSMLLEYTPQAIESAVNPEEFVLGLLRTHHCFDTGVLNSRLVEVTPNNVTTHRRDVSASTDRWVDLLLIPNTLPGAAEICDRIRAVSHGTLEAEGAEGNIVIVPAAQGLVRQADFAGAINLLLKGGAPSHNGMTKYLLGYSLHRVGRHAEAEAQLRDALALGFNGALVNLALAYCRRAVGDATGAAEYFAKSEAIDPNHSGVADARKLFAAG